VSISPATDRSALSGKQWRVLILLVISAFINYIDRTTLSVATTDIQRELLLNNTQVGLLQSAFFLTYAFPVVPSFFFRPLTAWNQMET
jgi:sugar phosphate permease